MFLGLEGITMKITIKPKFEEAMEVDLKPIAEGDVEVFNYTTKQLKEIRRVLLEILDNDEYSSEDIDECQMAFQTVKDALYINGKVDMRKINKVYVKTLYDDDLINLRNSIIKVLNQHIILYDETKDPLYNKTVEVSTAVLILIMEELKSRKLRVDLTWRERRELKISLNNWSSRYPITPFN